MCVLNALGPEVPVLPGQQAMRDGNFSEAESKFKRAMVVEEVVQHTAGLMTPKKNNVVGQARHASHTMLKKSRQPC